MVVEGESGMYTTQDGRSMRPWHWSIGPMLGLRRRQSPSICLDNVGKLAIPLKSANTLTLNSGAGNYHSPKPDGEERGRDSHKGHGGVFGNVIRSLSRAKGGERSKD